MLPVWRQVSVTGPKVQDGVNLGGSMGAGSKGVMQGCMCMLYRKGHEVQVGMTRRIGAGSEGRDVRVHACKEGHRVRARMIWWIVACCGLTGHECLCRLLSECGPGKRVCPLDVWVKWE